MSKQRGGLHSVAFNVRDILTIELDDPNVEETRVFGCRVTGRLLEVATTMN